MTALTRPALVIAFVLAASALPGAVSAQEPSRDKPGPAAEHVYFNSFFVDRAPLDMAAGNMDLYLFGLKPEAALELEDEEGVQLIDAPATSLSLLLNPAPAPEGELNPFSIPAVRTAMQYLIDREFIAREIYQGFGQPMVTHVGPSDPDFLTVYDIDRGSGIVYDPEAGRQLISQAMMAAGAELVDGKWHFNGEPIGLRFITRVEDERRDIGNLVADELTKAGFLVTIDPKTFGPAVQAVYSTDPKLLGWHLYTEGWGRSAPQRYDVGAVNSYNAPWLGNMPGWKEQGFWQYENAELDEMGKRLFRGEFDSLEERDEIYRAMTELGQDESVRLWLATVVNSFPADAELTGFTPDLVAGPRTPWMLREAYVPGSDTIKVGHQWVWTDRTTWNPVGGFGDVYSVDIWRNIFDPPLWNHPFTGIPQPFRADYKVKTAGPEGTLEVPEDAVLWDPTSNSWVAVPAGSTAVSKVTFDFSRYLDANWHHGQPIELADAVYSIAQGFDLAYDDEKVRIETALAATSRPYLETFKGFRLTDDDQLEVYVDFWHFADDYIASYASPTSFDMPWEVLAAMDELVFGQRRAAYSDTAASRFNVPWLSLVMRQDAGLVERVLREFEREGTVPEGVFQFGDRTLVSPEEATERYQAAMDWYDEHDHMVISNGPYSLVRFDPGANFAELLAFRDESYPFKPGDHFLGEPPSLTIGEVRADPVVPGEAAEIGVSVEGPGTLGVRYLLLDPALGKVVDQGEAQAGEGGSDFVVPISAQVSAELFPGGLYQLNLAAYSDELALVTERRVPLDVSP